MLVNLAVNMRNKFPNIVPWKFQQTELKISEIGAGTKLNTEGNSVKIKYETTDHYQ